MSDIESFDADLSQLGDRVISAAARIQKEAFNDLAREIVVGGAYSPGTPVASGAARGHWGVSIDGNGGPPPFVKTNVDPAGDATLGVIHQAVLGSPPLSATELANSAPYIDDLENGRSGQAPEGMVRTAVAQWPTIATKAAERVIAEDLDQGGRP